MNKKTRDLLNGLGMLAATIGMIALGATLIYVIGILLHPHHIPKA